MLTRLIQNPLTRKRLRRFRARRRAHVSLWILAIAYVLSLGSEFISNDRPLIVRCNGRWFIPVLRYYPEDAFLHNGQQTRPNYRALNATPLFGGKSTSLSPSSAPSSPLPAVGEGRPAPHRAEGSGAGVRGNNFMIFPPIPFGPYESIDPASLPDATTVRVTFTPMPHVGNVNVSSNFIVERAQACGVFFATNDASVVGADLTQHWPISKSLREAVARRLNNQSAPEFLETLTSQSAPAQTAALSIPAFTPREEAPTSVRITFRDADRGTKTASMAFAPDGLPLTHTAPAVWSQLSDGERDYISNTVTRAMQEYVPSTQIAVGGNAFRLDIRKKEVTWPHEPVRGHWFGIDSAGRDVLARIIYGFRISMSFGFLLVVATMVLGVIIGGVQGYLGGRTDLITQRMIEIWSALPFLYVVILLGSIYGRSFALLLICYGIFNWIGISYYMRGEFLRLRRQPYVEAARCLGVPGWRIMLEHILPNALTPLITFFPFLLVGAISALYSLDYLGFGLPPPTASWGELLFQAQQFRSAWWLTLYPAAAIFIVMLLGVFVGEGIRDAFDPKPISRME